MDRDEEAAAWLGRRRRRDYAVAAVITGVVAAAFLAVGLLGQSWAWGLVGAFVCLSSIMLVMWRKQS